MSRGSRAAWNTILGVKNRAMDRLARTMAEQRAELAQRRDVATEKNEQVIQCRTGSERHVEQLDALLECGSGISPQLYLDHDAHRRTLQDELDAAIEDAKLAEQEVVAMQNDIRETSARIAKVKAQCDLIKKKIVVLDNAVLEAEQNTQDEESAETSLARHIRAARLQESAV